jgi:succinylglutamate desuccinylase
LKPIDKAIRRMVANHQAVAQANAYVASTMNRSGGRARNREGEGSRVHRNLIDAMNHFGGVEATAW